MDHSIPSSLLLNDPQQMQQPLHADEFHSRWLEDADETIEDAGGGKSGSSLAGAILSNVFLFFLIFGMSATVDCRNLKHQLTNKFAICTGVAMQFLIMPVLGYLAVVIFGKADSGHFTESMGITLLVVTASPGGSYSNWWCSLFNAELALSVAMTTVSSLMSIALLPANLFLYTYLAYGEAKNEAGQGILQALDFTTIFYTLAIVLSAIISGLAAGYRWDTHNFHVVCNKIGSVCGILLILFSLFLSSGADGAEAKAWNQHWTFYLAVALPCLVGLALANIIARSVKLSPPETVAIAIECCYQNTGIATSVAITMFEDKEARAQAVAVPLFYGVIEAVAIAIYCVYAWKIGWTKAPADEKICVVISKTYEVADEDEGEGDGASDASDAHEQDLEGGKEADDAKKPAEATGSPPRRRMDTSETAISSQAGSSTPGTLPLSPSSSIPEIDDDDGVGFEVTEGFETPEASSESSDGNNKIQ